MRSSVHRQAVHGGRRVLTPVRRAVIGLAACALVAAVAACSSSGPGVSGGAGTSAGGAAAGGSTSATTIRIGLTNSAITAYSANYVVGQYLGCYQKYGYKVSVQGYNGPTALLAAFQQGSVDVGIPGSDQYTSFVQTIKKSGNSTPLKAFYELAYPFRYGMAVLPGSGITSLSQLAGKTVGIDTESDSSNATLEAVEKQAGLASGSIKTVATGTGAASAQALETGKVSALWFNDSGTGAILGDGVKLSLVLVDGKKPFVNAGGILAFTTAKEYDSDQKMFQAFATCSTEGDIFTAANPAAASYILLKEYPQLGLVGQPLAKQLANLDIGITLRAPLFHSTVASVQYGAMNETEFVNDQSILLGQSGPYLNMSPYWTNSLIATANSSVDTAAITKQAQDFKIPGLSGSVPLPAIPSNSP
jgi:ABC-type nitrate/sulfonate/bicarbonate transport system substrate-binding protein